MATTISNPTVTPANRQGTVTGVSPSSASDGKYTWSVVGESADGSALVFRAEGFGTAASGIASGNALTATMTSSTTSQTSFIQVTAAYSGKSDKSNWTVQVGSSGNTAQTFRKGGGGGH